MKKVLLLLIMLLCNSVLAVDPQVDLDQIIHVDATSGNDADTGVGFSEARATIIEAITDSADGDVILIWPGVYDEAVDITTTQVHLKGTNRYFCKIVRTGVGEVGVLLGDNTSLTNLWIETQAENNGAVESYAVDGSDNGGADNAVIENCIIKGTYIGLYVTGEDNVTVRNCVVTGTRKALVGNGMRNLLVENCQIESDSSFDPCNQTEYSGLVVNGDGVVVKNTTVRISSNHGALQELAFDMMALETASTQESSITLVNNVFTTKITGSHTGNVYGYRSTHPNGNSIAWVTATNCVFRADSVAGTATAAAIRATKNNIVLANNCILLGDDFATQTADNAKIFLNACYFVDESKFSGSGTFLTNRFNVGRY